VKAFRHLQLMMHWIAMDPAFSVFPPSIGESTKDFKATRGFTLVELLVTLVILGFITAALSQAMFGFQQIDRLLADRAIPSQAESVRVEWIREALSSIQPPANAGRNPLKGDAHSLSGICGNPIAEGSAGFGALNLQLQFDADSGMTVLYATLAGKPLPVPLLRWGGSVGNFYYFDATGTRYDSWPPLIDKHDPLPAVIALTTGLELNSVIVGAPLADNDDHPSRLILEDL
jgi:prepilin-type N-terminal cleavage/methylation domain-containing protein